MKNLRRGSRTVETVGRRQAEWMEDEVPTFDL